MLTAIVTGAAGFLGRHFVRELLKREYHVIGVDVKGLSHSEMPHVNEYTHIIQDCRELFLRGFASKHSIWPQPASLVVHCAAVEPHRAAIDSVNTNFQANLSLDAMMFAWAAMTEQERVLYISSSAVYPVDLQSKHFYERTLDEDLVDRDDDIEIRPPDKTYGWCKWMGEYQAREVARTGLPVHVVRPFSGYGEDQSINFPFRAFVERARRRDDPFAIWGNADQTRDWIHVTDLVRGALAVVDADHREPVNLCTGVSTSMRDLARLCMKIADYTAEIRVDANAPMGVMHRVGNPTTFKQFYQPEITIEEGVRRAMNGV